MMLEKINRTTWASIHFVEKSVLSQEKDDLRKSGLAIFEMDGSSIRNKDDLLSEIARAMHFPGYFGTNWDALEECLRDLEWVPASGYVVLFSNADALWQKLPRVMGALIESWLFCAEYWSSKSKPFHLIFVW